MANITFPLIGSIFGLAIAALQYPLYWRSYRRIPSLEAFTTSQRRVLTYQILAISLWTTSALGYLFYMLWSGPNWDLLSRPPSNIIITVLNWCFLGFAAVTSIVAGVSILPGLRSWTWIKPARGRDSIITGIVILGLLAYGTW